LAASAGKPSVINIGIEKPPNPEEAKVLMRSAINAINQ